MIISQLSLEELFDLRSQFLLEGLNTEKITDLILIKESEYVKQIFEDGATGGPAGSVAASSVGYGGNGVAYANATIGGMGQVTASQPSIYAGSTTGAAYTSGGGVDGSGDVSIPYNPGGRKKVFQKMASPLSDRRGTNKRRRNKILRGLKNTFSQKQDYTSGQGKVKKSNIMNFDNFAKDQFTKVTKVKQ